MIEGVSKYFQRMGSEGPEGNPVFEQVYPPSSDGTVERFVGHDDVIKFLTDPNTVRVSKVSDREVGPRSPHQHKGSPINPRLEVTGLGETFTLPGWDQLLRNDTALIGTIEMQLGATGLNIVWEPGITERKV